MTFSNFGVGFNTVLANDFEQSFWSLIIPHFYGYNLANTVNKMEVFCRQILFLLQDCMQSKTDLL